MTLQRQIRDAWVLALFLLVITTSSVAHAQYVAGADALQLA